MNNPLVSVLMPAYNAASYIEGACVSLLTQTYSNLEIIIIDDGSTDETVSKVKAIKDSRIHLFLNNTNKGLAASLNTAIRHAKGKYFARMDADDICHPKRIQKQVDFLEENPDVSLLGTGLKYFNNSDYKNYFPGTHELCKAKLLFNVCFGHPSLMFRSSVFTNENNLYDPELRQYSEDYELYSRLVDRFHFKNLQHLLVRYRTFGQSIKGDDESKRKHNSRFVRKRMLLAMGLTEKQVNLEIHSKAADLARLTYKNEFDEIATWFDFLMLKNSITNYFDSKALSQQLSEQLFEVAYNNPHFHVKLASLRCYSFYRLNTITWNKRLKYLIKKSFYSL